MNFTDKKVWITGASSGIGEALTYKFSELGARLIISSRRESELQRVKAACKYPDKVTIVPLDLEKYHDIAAIATPIVEQMGAIDILITTAGQVNAHL